VTSAGDALQYLMAGATLVGVGTAALANPRLPSGSSRTWATGARAKESPALRTSSVPSNGRRHDRRADPIVALDVPTLVEAKSSSRDSAGSDFYKVGLQLFTREGPAAVEWLRGESKRVFLDLKLHDIPTPSPCGGLRRGARRRPADVHASAATRCCARQSKALRARLRTGILASPFLTSFDDTGYGDASSSRESARRMPCRDSPNGPWRAAARGVVCAGSEAVAVRREHGEALGILVPGLRAANTATQDQARVVTPAEARDAGATWVVLGRMVTASARPRKCVAGRRRRAARSVARTRAGPRSCAATGSAGTFGAVGTFRGIRERP